MTWRAGVHSVIGLALLRPSAPAPEGVDYRNWLGRKARRCQRRPVRISLSVLWTLPSDTPTLAATVRYSDSPARNRRIAATVSGVSFDGGIRALDRFQVLAGHQSHHPTPPRPRTQLLIGQIPRQPVRVADQGIPNLQISVDVLNCAPR